VLSDFGVNFCEEIELVFDVLPDFCRKTAKIFHIIPHSSF